MQLPPSADPVYHSNVGFQPLESFQSDPYQQTEPYAQEPSYRTDEPSYQTEPFPSESSFPLGPQFDDTQYRQ